MKKQYTTVLPQIVSLYAQERELLDKLGDSWLTDEERDRFASIRRALESLWPVRRQEIALQLHGPPRIIRAQPDARDQRQNRQVAFGIAPLPGGR